MTANDGAGPVWAWWFTFLLANYVSARGLESVPTNFGALLAVNAIGSVGAIIAAILAIRLVRQITYMQQVRHDEVVRAFASAA